MKAENSAYRIQPADPKDLGRLPEIEVQAATIFPDEDIAPELRGEGIPLAVFERAAVECARACGHSSLTLTTFRHLPWNAPFYQRLGFVKLSRKKMGDELVHHLSDEVRRSLDSSKRVVMRLSVTPAP